MVELFAGIGAVCQAFRTSAVHSRAATSLFVVDFVEKFIKVCILEVNSVATSGERDCKAILRLDNIPFGHKS